MDGLSSPSGTDNAPKPEEKKQPAPPVPEAPEYNAMASVLERHERISNRVRNKNP